MKIATFAGILTGFAIVAFVTRQALKKAALTAAANNSSRYDIEELMTDLTED